MIFIVLVAGCGLVFATCLTLSMAKGRRAPVTGTGLQPTFRYGERVRVTGGVYEGRWGKIDGERLGEDYPVEVEVEGSPWGKFAFIPHEWLRHAFGPPQGGSVLAPPLTVVVGTEGVLNGRAWYRDGDGRVIFADPDLLYRVRSEAAAPPDASVGRQPQTDPPHPGPLECEVSYE